MVLPYPDPLIRGPGLLLRPGREPVVPLLPEGVGTFPRKRVDAMETIGIKVDLTLEASREVERILRSPHQSVSEWGLKYLEGLLQLPPEKWREISLILRGGAFRVTGRIPFDIRGKVFADGAGRVERVLVTRFKLKGKFSEKQSSRKFKNRRAVLSVCLN